MNAFKTIGFGLAGALALAAAPAANAADIYQGGGGLKDAPVVDYAPPITWTGFYIGANLGGAWDDSSDVEILSDSELVGGAHLGYNWQGPRNLVLGIEGDVDFLNDVDYLATVRGRLGYSFGPTLAYATGGAAFIGLSDDFGGDSDTGWVAGAGLERMVTQNVSVGAEGLYYSFDNNDVGDAAFWTARARLTYHFGGYSNSLK